MELNNVILTMVGLFITRKKKLLRNLSVNPGFNLNQILLIVN